MTKRCIELVKRFEGFSPTVYLCPAGYPTIGYGHVVLPNEQYKTITKTEAEILLIKDLLKLEKAIIPLIKVNIHPFMLDALISFSYNVGVFAFKASTLRKKLNQKDYIDASNEFLRWIYAGGKKLKGLMIRRQEEKKLFLEGLSLLNY